MSREIPGDELIPKPDMSATRAITIDAPASTIWPWLVQLGSARGGAYTYDWIKNIFGLDVHSAEEILPEFQHLEVGDVLPMGRSGCLLLPEQSFPFAPGSQPPPRVEPTRLHLARATRRVRSHMPLASSHALNRRGRCGGIDDDAGLAPPRRGVLLHRAPWDSRTRIRSKSRWPLHVSGRG